MRTIVAALLILSVAGLPALSQGFGRNERLDKMYEEQQKRMKEDEKEYNETIKRVRPNEGSRVQNDPWRNVRPIENPTRR